MTISKTITITSSSHLHHHHGCSPTPTSSLSSSSPPWSSINITITLTITLMMRVIWWCSLPHLCHHADHDHHHHSQHLHHHHGDCHHGDVTKRSRWAAAWLAMVVRTPVVIPGEKFFYLDRSFYTRREVFIPREKLWSIERCCYTIIHGWGTKYGFAYLCNMHCIAGEGVWILGKRKDLMKSLPRYVRK